MEGTLDIGSLKAHCVCTTNGATLTLLDIMATFHSILQKTYKIGKLGISFSYLTNRKQFFNVYNCISKTEALQTTVVVHMVQCLAHCYLVHSVDNTTSFASRSYETCFMIVLTSNLLIMIPGRSAINSLNLTRAYLFNGIFK